MNQILDISRKYNAFKAEGSADAAFRMKIWKATQKRVRRDRSNQP